MERRKLELYGAGAKPKPEPIQVQVEVLPIGDVGLRLVSRDGLRLYAGQILELGPEGVTVFQGLASESGFERDSDGAIVVRSCYGPSTSRELRFRMVSEAELKGLRDTLKLAQGQMDCDEPSEAADMLDRLAADIEDLLQR